MKKFTIYNLQFTILIAILAFAFYIVHSTLYIDPASAQIAGCTPQTSNPRVQEGLISTPNISTNFSNPTGTCIVDPAKAPFAPFKIPSYDDLKSIYFTQSKTTKTPSAGTNVSPITLSDDGKVFNYTAPDVNINGTYNYNGTAVIFIDGNINIGGNIRSLDPNKGLVMVVKNNVNIDPGVSRIDAVIISSGTIYTAGAGCSVNSVTTANPLTVNGSLVSLDSSKQINFCRKLSSVSQAAEQINEQPKYLVILRNLYADTLQKWSEITAEPVLAPTTPTVPTTPTPTPTPSPTPTPTLMPTPSPTPTAPAGSACSPPNYCTWPGCETTRGSTWLSQYTCKDPGYRCCSPATISMPGDYYGTVRVRAYYDKNQNQIWDQGEEEIRSLTASLARSGNYITFDRRQTPASFSILNGLSYSVYVLADAAEWEPVSGGTKKTASSYNSANGACACGGYGGIGGSNDYRSGSNYIMASCWTQYSCQLNVQEFEGQDTCYGYGPWNNSQAGQVCWENQLKNWPAEYWVVQSSAYISQPNEVKEINIPFSKPRPVLTNGDFTNQLSNWDCTGDKGGTCTASSDTYASAPYSAFIQNTGGGWGWQIQQRGISASYNQQFCLSARVAKNSAGDTAGVALQEGGSPWREVDILAPNQTGWQFLRQTVQVGSNWVLPVQVFARVWNKDGAAWFDDITLTSGACQ